MVNLKDEILNSEYKDRVLSIVEFKEKKENILDLLKALMGYSNIILTEDYFEKYKREIETYKHFVVVLSDFDLKPEEKLKLKTDFISKYLDIIKNNKMDLWLHVLLIEDIKNISMDSRFELIDLLSLGDILYDKGFIEIVRLTSVHKKLILDMLQRYVVAYVLAGSQVKGRSIESSDVDVYVVIDDTDVKQHTFEELKAKLISIIAEKAIESRLIIGSKKILHPQVYTLTEYWLALSESNPVIITFLRDGIALYDRGMFISWKQLLLKGILKPSQEASEKFITAADNAIKDAREKLKNTINNLIVEDLAVAMVTAGQSVIMDYGLLPGDPKETPQMLRKLFVEKGLIQEQYINDLEEVWKMRKDFEHGVTTEYKYEDLLNVFDKAEKFISEMKNLKQIVDRENLKKNTDNYILMYEELKNKFKGLFGEDILSFIEKNMNVELNGIKDLEDNINKYKNKQFDLIETEKFREKILYYVRLLRDLIEDRKEEIVIRYKYTIIDKENKKLHDLYISKNKLYIVKDDGIEIYDYNGNKVGTINDINYKEEMIKELGKEGVEYLDNNIMNLLAKIFKDYALSK